MPSRDLAVVRIYGLLGGARATAGMGALVGSRHVVTCAHVVNAALRREHRHQPRPEPEQLVQVEFPLISGKPVRNARVVAWTAPAARGSGGDVAGLELTEDAPLAARPARFAAGPAGAAAELQVFGYPQEVTRNDGVWVHVRRIGTVEGGLIQVESRSDQSIRAQPGYSGSPVWQDDKIIGLLHAAAAPDQPYRDAYLLPPELVAAAWPEQLDYLLIPPNPYRGLETFTARHAGMFFGRERAIASLTERVRRRAVTMLVGPSGVGKSSLVQAGLIPRLRGTGPWSVALVRPGREPWHRLAIGILRALNHPGEGSPPAWSAAEIEHTVERLRAEGLGWAARLTGGQDRPLLLIVDQFEQLLVGDAPEVRLLEVLLPERSDHDDGHRLVHTLRADFMRALLEIPGVGPRLEGRLFPLSPMTAGEMREAIVRPAEALGVTYQPGLVDEIVEDAAQGTLPLLEFALTRLWGTQRRRTIDFTVYRAAGKIGTALDRFADEQVIRLSATPPALLDSVLLKLVQLVGDDLDRAIRRRVYLSDLTDRDAQVLQHLAEARLVVLDDEPRHGRFAELAHEALITSWERLRELVRGNAEFLEWLQATRRRADEGDPLPQARIAEAEAWITQRADDIPARLLEFVQRSRAAADRQVQDRLEATIAQVQAEIARRQASAATDRAKALRLAADCEQASATDRPLPMQVALALAVESVLTTPTLQGRLALQQILGRHPRALVQIEGDQYHTAVAVGRGGRLMAVGGSGGEIHVLDTGTGAVRVALSHGPVVLGLAFDAEGVRVAAAGQDNVVRVYDCLTAAELLTLPHADEVVHLAFDPGGTLLATAGRDGLARVFDTADGTELVRFEHNGAVSKVAFVPTDDRLATASRDREVRIFEFRDGLEVSRLPHHREVLDVAYSEDGSLMATASGGSAQVFDAVSGELQARCDLDRSVTSVTFSPDGGRVVAAGMDWTARILDTTGVNSPVVLKHGGPVLAVDFSPDGLRVATISARSLRVFSAVTGAEQARFDHDSDFIAVSFTGRGDRVMAAAINGSAFILQIPTGAERLRFAHSAFHSFHAPSEVRAVAFDPGGKRLATASSDMTVRLFDCAGGGELARMHHHDAVLALTFSRDGRRVATGDRAGIARVFDAEPGRGYGREVTRIEHGAEVTMVAFAPGGDRVASASKDRTVRVFDAATGAEHLNLEHDGAVSAVTFDRRGARLATGGEAGDRHGVACVFDAGSGARITRVDHGGTVAAVTFSPDGAFVATASYDHTARIFDAATGRVRAVFAHDREVACVAFSPDGGYLATGGYDQALRLFDVAAGAERFRINHWEAVVAVVFSADGERIATASHDRTARVFEVATGAELARFDHDEWVTAVAFAPDGSTVATASRDAFARSFEVDPGLLIERALQVMTRPMREHELRQHGLRWNCRHVEQWARMHAAQGDVEQMRVLLNILLTRGDDGSLEEAERLLDALQPAGNLGAERGALAMRRGVFADGLHIWREEAYEGNVRAVAKYVPIAAVLGDLEGAEGLLQRESDGLILRRSYLDVVGRRLTEAQRHHLRAVGGPADTDTINFLGLDAYLDGRLVEAEELWSEAAQLGDCGALYLLTRLPDRS
ncbi:trypsin-like peptidase domain-containing protein [Dactylosporangium sp. CA-092794]|uniref:nSTAND1 domain-containing NTPase n=1 Tax=Dactylosporangium sp. CA-092794 TaxID=3239929 RepID=UPI003D8D90C3